MNEVENTENTDSKTYQIIVCNVKWNDRIISSRIKKTETNELPESVVLDIPENVLKHAVKKNVVFNDVIEQFAYNTLSRKYNHEISFAQVWLPLEDYSPANA